MSLNYFIKSKISSFFAVAVLIHTVCNFKASMKLSCFNFQIIFFKVNSQVQTGEDEEVQCYVLNEVRANFTFCCKYPILVIEESDYNKCEEECSRVADEHYG